MMKKAWVDIKSFITVSMVIAYILFTYLDKITPDFQNIVLMIIAFYFGTQAEKIQSKIKGEDNNDSKINANK